jgi:hypothetical protein
MTEICFSILQPFKLGLLDFLVILKALTIPVIFQEPKQLVGQRGRVQTVERIVEHFPAKLSVFSNVKA